MEVKRIGVWSAGKVSGAIYAVLGLVFGLFFALVGLLAALIGAGSSGTQEGVMGAMGMGLFGGVASLVVLPIFYGILGLVSGLIGAFLYNVVARVIGGVEVDLSRDHDITR